MAAAQPVESEGPVFRCGRFMTAADGQGGDPFGVPDFGPVVHQEADPRVGLDVAPFAAVGHSGQEQVAEGLVHGESHERTQGALRRGRGQDAQIAAAKQVSGGGFVVHGVCVSPVGALPGRRRRSPVANPVQEHLTHFPHA